MSAIAGDDPEFRDALPKPGPRRGFRLFHLLAVVGGLGLLLALLLPATRSAGPAARRFQCVSNLKQILLALSNYEYEYQTLPPAYTVDAEGRPLHSWRTLILPYLEEGPLYRTIDLSKPWNDPANAKARETPLGVFRCPGAVGPGNRTAYLAIAAPDGCFPPGACRPLAEITDPHNATIMVIEAGQEDAVPWMAPVDAAPSLVMKLGPTSKLHHPGGMNAGFVDGSATFLSARLSAGVRRALMTVAGKDNQSGMDWE